MRTYSNSFWKDRRTFITGHTGFKGAWLSYLLSSLGARVSGLALAPENEEQFFNVAEVDQLLDHSFIADVRDRAVVRKALLTTEPDVIFHLAAQPLVRHSYDHPYETFDVNVMGTVNVLEEAIGLGRPVTVVVITTDKVYENQEQIWPYREYDSLGGFDPYSASKSCAELVIRSYSNSIVKLRENSVGIASARAGNVIGGADWSTDRLLPDIFRSLKSGNEIRLRNPSATRPWQHVLDCLYGYILLAESLSKEPLVFSDSWNFGPVAGDEWTVEAVVCHVVKGSVQEGKVKFDSENIGMKKEHNFLTLDSTKAHKLLGWAPRLRVEQALDLTKREYRAATGHATFLRQVNESIQTVFGKGEPG